MKPRKKCNSSSVLGEVNALSNAFDCFLPCALPYRLPYVWPWPLVAMFRLVTDVIRALDGKEHVYGFFFDLSKAFDVVYHQMLLEKLEFIEMRSSRGVDLLIC